MNLLTKAKQRHSGRKKEGMSLESYLELASKDPSVYATPAERMLKAIGEPTFLNTRDDPRLSRIFSNRIIKTYPAFSEFYGMELVVEQIVSYFKHSAQGLEERKQVLYLLGPVGGGKSSLAEKLKSLMEKEPIYVIKAGDQISPVFESPLGLFKKEDSKDLNIPERYLKEKLSPWALKRLEEFDGDLSKFTVVKLYPSQDYQIALAKTEPGDENNQDISALVGKIDIRKLAKFSQNDADAYSYSGGLCLANQGLLEFVEMFKAPIKVLHPLLTATQEGNYNGTEAISSIPFDGIVLAHSNEAEWQSFKQDKNNEAFLDRIYIVKVPYCLRLSEEIKIYEKLIRESSLKTATCAPETLKILATLEVLSRVTRPDNSDIFSKLKVYDGLNIKEEQPTVKSYQEYKDAAGVDEGMTGLSTRFAFKILSKTFNYDSDEIAANPVHLLYLWEKQLEQEKLLNTAAASHIATVREEYKKFLEREIKTAFLESYHEYGQNLFERYVTYADYWEQDKDYVDPDTGQLLDRIQLNSDLEVIEKPAGISNPKDFRREVVAFVMRAQIQNKGVFPNWKSYHKLREVIEAKMFSSIEDLLPQMSFSTKVNKADQQKHADFVARMVSKGYTSKQVRILVEWFERVRKS